MYDVQCHLAVPEFKDFASLQKKASSQRFVSESWVDPSLFPATDVGSKLLFLTGGFEDETTA
jgi:hypothetical protein